MFDEFDEPKRQKIARILELPVPTTLWDMLEDLITEYGDPIRAILSSIKAHHTEKFGALDEIKIAPALYHTTIPLSQQKLSSPSVITEGKMAKITENGKKFEERTRKELEKVDELIAKISELGTLQESQKVEERNQINWEKIDELISKIDELEELQQAQKEELQQAQKEVLQQAQKEVLQQTKKETIQQAQKEVESKPQDWEKVEEIISKVGDLSALKDIKSELSSMKSMIRNLQSTGVSASTGISRKRADLSSLDISIGDSSDVPMEAPERPSLESVLDSVLLFDEEEEVGLGWDDEQGTEDSE